MKTRKWLIFTVLIFASILTLTESCKKDKEEDDDTNNSPATDNVSPHISITSPTAEFSYMADENTIAISGVANDNTGVTKILWKGPGGTSGTATGTETWSVSSINLAGGDNLFTFIAYDAANNTDTSKILVTFNEYLNFLGPLMIDPAGFFVNISTPVTFSINILNNPNLVANSIMLIKVNQEGNMIEEVCELFDDGDLGHGDDILGDGVYSNVQSLIETNPGLIKFRVRAATNETSGTVYSYSQVSNLAVVDEIATETIQEILEFQLAADVKFQEYIETQSFDDAVNSTLAFLDQSSLVMDAQQTNSGDIWIQFQYGLEGMLLTTTEGNEGGQSQVKDRASGPTIPANKQTRGIGPNYLNGSKEDENVVLDKDVLLYAPNWDEFNGWGTEFLDNVENIIEDSECPNFNINYVKNSAADLDVLRTLSDYGLIVIHTHGGLDPDNNVVFLTGDEVDYFDYDELLDWLLGNIYSVPFHGKSMWIIKPAYITAHNGNYPNSIVYNGSCESAHNNTMANAFINNGANTYFGFSQTVKSWFDRDMANELFPSLITDGLTTGEAFVPNQHDDNNPPAYFVMLGNEDTHFTSDFTNGDFEEGSLVGWEVDGDGRIITQLGYIAPYGGNYMGIISTGLGYTVETGSISQNFCVPADATTLSLNWNFLSEEFLEWVGSQFQDYFQVSIIDDQGIETVLFYKTIDMINAEYPPSLVSPDIVFDQGDVYGTGWQFSSFDISAFAGQGVTLVLKSGDVGDSIYDTVILLDDILVD
jgi:hypothetical protein